MNTNPGSEDRPAALARQAAELEILRRVAGEVNATLDLEEIYDIALRTMDQLFEFHHALVLLVEPGGETLRVVASRGYENQAIGGRVRVGIGAVGIGGAYGDGGVFKAGKMIGKSSISQVTIGLGLGGEQYTEVVFFKDKKSFDRFVEGNVEFDAHATAVAADKGVGGALGYNNGVAIFTFTKGGLMADASVGGQKFSYQKL